MNIDILISEAPSLGHIWTDSNERAALADAYAPLPDAAGAGDGGRRQMKTFRSSPEPDRPWPTRPLGSLERQLVEWDCTLSGPKTVENYLTRNGGLPEDVLWPEHRVQLHDDEPPADLNDAVPFPDGRLPRSIYDEPYEVINNMRPYQPTWADAVVGQLSRDVTWLAICVLWAMAMIVGLLIAYP